MYRKNKNSNSDGRPLSERAVEKFADMMVKRMEEMQKSHWKQGWTDGAANFGMPRNIVSGTLNNSNAFFLMLHTSMSGFTMPVYMTFKQAKNLGLKIAKGAEAVPVVYWNKTYKDKDGKPIDRETYVNMTDEEREECKVSSFLKVYPEFNVDQTNLKEAKPEKYAKLLAFFKSPEVKDDAGMYANAAIDRMLERQEWLCPVKYQTMARGASYTPALDRIVIPMKSQFRISDTPEGIYQDGMEYYSTFIHEAAHSTGHPDRLNREKGGRFGDKVYAKEELVAEMSAAVAGSSLGFSKRILDNNTAYVKGWISNLRENPKIVLTVMGEVSKAANMILDKVNEQKVALGEEPIIDSMPMLDEEETGDIRLEATRQSAVEAVVERTADKRARAFNREQQRAISDYAEAAGEAQGVPVGEADKTVRQQLFMSLFDQAQPRMRDQHLCPAWQEDTRRELKELSEGHVRQQPHKAVQLRLF